MIQLMKILDYVTSPKTMISSRFQSNGTTKTQGGDKEYVGDLEFVHDSIRIKDKIIKSLNITNGTTRIQNCEIQGKTELMNGITDFSNSTLSDIDGQNQTISVVDSNLKGEFHNMNNADPTFDASLQSTVNTTIIRTNMYGNIKNYNGVIEITDSKINGNIKISNGTLVLKNTAVQGDIAVSNGKLHIENSSTKKATIPTNLLTLNGENFIAELNLTNNAKIEEFRDLKLISGNMMVKRKHPHEPKPTNNHFILKNGTSLNGIVTFTESFGTIILEEGANFKGKVINGNIIKKGLKHLH